jgi:hypothetical protein
MAPPADELDVVYADEADEAVDSNLCLPLAGALGGESDTSSLSAPGKVDVVGVPNLFLNFSKNGSRATDSAGLNGAGSVPILGGRSSFSGGGGPRVVFGVLSVSRLGLRIRWDPDELEESVRVCT